MELKKSYDTILVGGGPSTRILNKYLHLFQPEISTLVIRDEERIVNHCGTPYIVEGVIPWERGLIAEKLVTRFGTPILVDPLVGGDTERREIETASGRRIGYQTLVLATGTDQILPRLPGIDLEQVLKVRKTEDLIQTMARLEGVERVTVLGAGYIGLEFAHCLNALGKQVTVVEAADHVMGGRIDRTMAEAIEESFRNGGVKVVLGRRAEALVGENEVRAVQLEGGEQIESDAVLPAVGVRPLVGYAAALGLQTTPNGIVVNDDFETGVDGIYALGDCIETRSLITGKAVPGKLGSNAGQMARRLALNLAGLRSPYPGVINAAITKFGSLSYGGAGLSEADAEAEGIEVLTSRNSSTSRYENMPDTKPVETKLIYRADDLRLLGGEILGAFNPAGFVETLAQLIERGSRLEDVLTMSYSSHPELTPKTSKPFFVWASEPLLKTLARSGSLGRLKEKKVR